MQKKSKNQANDLPLVKPILLKSGFTKAIKGGLLNSDVVIAVATDEQYVYFIEAHDKNTQETCKDIQLEYLNEDKPYGLHKYVYVNSLKIFKMLAKDLKTQVSVDFDVKKNSAILDYQSQLSLVRHISERLNDDMNLPKLVYLKRSNANLRS
ncbi:hypothetical protein [Mycoplasmopsis opalescens]|uniref:hypothetical protein n=1 Tax=Mycoplasmopsis opalescens TaxID=114886 RepID=UPI0004A6F528|nr:hypothetical protein [Mycoplasmopsis opalescens]